MKHRSEEPKTYESGQVVVDVCSPRYQLEWELGTISGAGVVFLRISGAKHNVPIGVDDIPEVCKQLTRMHRAVTAFRESE